MSNKNLKKEKPKERKTWVGYFPRVTKNKKTYTRKIKHKNKDV